jgi:hypothetical protein
MLRGFEAHKRLAQFLNRVSIPGVRAFVQCSDEYLNINAERNEFEASACDPALSRSGTRKQKTRSTQL